MPDVAHETQSVRGSPFPLYKCLREGPALPQIKITEMLPRSQNQGFELDALEDIFRQKERDLEQGILNFTSRDKERDTVLRTKEDDRMLTDMQFTINGRSIFDENSSIIRVTVSRSNSCDEADVCDVNLAPRSPKLLSAPFPSLTFLRSSYNPPKEELFVSGVEAERQLSEIKTMGSDAAHALADRRANYNRKLRSLAERESRFVEDYVEVAKSEKKLQLIQLSDSIQSKGTKMSERRATLWRRCAAMAEVLAKEDAERLLWKKRFCVAANRVYGNEGFY